MSSPPGAAPDEDARILFAFDDWTFEPASGELRRGEAAPVRLQPQPAQLLTLLLDRAGEVVNRDDIVAAVWGHTTVEFDQAVNYGIRQIRIALGDSAPDGRYIETLPRRGYRFAVPVTRRPAPPKTARRRMRWPAAALPALGLATVIVLAGRAQDDEVAAPDGGASELPVIAVMALRHAEGDSVAAVASVRMAEALTAHLTQRTAGRFRVIGPTTTRRYGSGRDAVDPLRQALDATWVLGGSIATGRPDGLFLELIDARDGAHLWALTADPSEAILTSAVDSIDARLRPL